MLCGHIHVCVCVYLCVHVYGGAAYLYQSAVRVHELLTLCGHIHVCVCVCVCICVFMYMGGLLTYTNRQSTVRVHILLGA
jgi:hypothetical protein